MRFFDKRLSLFLLLFLLPLLFLPKINLVGFKSETAGIRIDDVFLLGFGGLLIWAHLILRKQIHKIENWIYLLTIFSILSFISNRFLYSYDILPISSKIFYTVRIFEYFLFFYIGALAAQALGSNRVVKLFFLWNIVLMALQKMKLVGALTVEGYVSDVSSRVQGIASFPSEMGLLLNLLFCYLIYDESSQSKLLSIFSPSIRFVLKKFYLLWMFALFGILIVFTGNRISILALLVCFLFKLKNETDFRSAISLIPLIIVLGGMTTGIAFIIYKTQSVWERSASLFSMQNFELIQIVWAKIDLIKDPVNDDVISAKNYDMSWWLRIHKWLYILKAYVNHPECYLQGLGPGCAWSALDGGWLRIFTEYGLIGSFIFWRFFSCLYNISTQLKWMMIAFGMNMIFFDAYLAYKTMSFLLFAAGYAWQKKESQFELMNQPAIA